ncbi:MAG: protein kinase [Anaerolineae bacterium]|nr:protein kinase [Anaerolineae bacterium]
MMGIPTRIAERYTIQRQIGTGGMGTVYRALDEQTGQVVAIKCLNCEVITVDPQMVERFNREADLLRQLEHPNIVTLYEAFEDAGQHFIVMELVEAGSLYDWLLEKGKLSVKQTLEIGLGVADALTRAHQMKVIHRDIKPANVLMATDGTPRLSDFGVARIGASNLTQTGRIVGTMAYLAPELLRDEQATPLTDIWAFGVLLFEMLAGRLPFRGGHPGAFVNAILTEALPDLEQLRPDTPLALIDLIYRMLMKAPEERIPSVRLVGAELESILSSGVSLTSTLSRGWAGARTGRRHTTLELRRFATPEATPGKRRSNLPAETTPFIGRAAELAALAGLVDAPQNRLVTVLAPGGMGKTRLALEFARGQRPKPRGGQRFRDGIFLVQLAPLVDAEDIVPTLIDAVGYVMSADGRSPRQQILDYLSEQEALLIFDNFEHVLAGAGLVADLLAAAPGLTVLATSRERLNLSGETLFTLGGMDFPAWETPEDALDYSAVQLFVQSARRARPGFELQAEELDYVARICRLVDGTPLGIVLAAAWVALLPLAEIAQEISASLDFLASEMRDLPARQRSLRAVFDYSWNLLSADEQATFARLAIFRGGFTREAAQTVTGAGLRNLGVLVSKSLLRRDAASGRYAVHELLRQYAEEQLQNSGQAPATEAAFVRYYTGFMAQRLPDLKGRRQIGALTEIEAEHENIKAAAYRALRLRDWAALDAKMDTFYLFAQMRNRQQEAEELFQMAREVIAGDPSLAQHPIRGRFWARFNDHEADPLGMVREALAIAEAHNNPAEIAFCTMELGYSHQKRGELGAAFPHFQAALPLYQALGDEYHLSQVMINLGWMLAAVGQPEHFMELMEASLVIKRRIGDRLGTASALGNLGVGAILMSGDYATAERNYLEGLALMEPVGDQILLSYVRSMLAMLAFWRSDWAQAEAFIEQTEAHFARQPLRDYRLESVLEELRGLRAFMAGDAATSRQHYEAVLTKDPYTNHSAFALWGIALTAAEMGDLARAAGIVREVSGSPLTTMVSIHWFLPTTTTLNLRAGNANRAAELLGLMETAPPGGNEWLARWAFFDQVQAEIRASLGEDAYQAALSRGRASSIMALLTEEVPPIPGEVSAESR